MDAITAGNAEERAKRAAESLVSALKKFNKLAADEQPLYDPSDLHEHITSVFVQALGRRFVITPDS